MRRAMLREVGAVAQEFVEWCLLFLPFGLRSSCIGASSRRCFKNWLKSIFFTHWGGRSIHCQILRLRRRRNYSRLALDWRNMLQRQRRARSELTMGHLWPSPVEVRESFILVDRVFGCSFWVLELQFWPLLGAFWVILPIQRYFC